MSWVNDFASVLGIPASAVTLAGAIYAGCAAAEKAARPEALDDIGRILKDQSWSRSAQPSIIIDRVFRWTFGERHLSLICMKRSIAASGLMLLALVIVFWAKGGRDSGDARPMLAAAAGIVSLFLPDYLALGKTRLILRLLSRDRDAINIVTMVLLDVLLSVAISAGFLVVFQLAFFQSLPTSNMIDYILQGMLFLAGLRQPPEVMPLYDAFLLSTLFTSVWTILIFVSIAALKVLAPVQRFTGWFFNLDRHPVKAIGIVAGALVMMGSLIWMMLRAMI